MKHLNVILELMFGFLLVIVTVEMLCTPGSNIAVASLLLLVVIIIAIRTGANLE